MTTTITIRETGTSADGFTATIQFGPRAGWQSCGL